jgi:hypothetical protein
LTLQNNILGTKKAYVPELGEQSLGFFKTYSPNNDNYDINKNHKQIGVRPGYVLQARELTEIQTLLQNQFRLMLEGDKLGLGNGWIDEVQFKCKYEVTNLPSSLPQSAVDTYNNVYGDVVIPNGGGATAGVGDWLSSGGTNVANYTNFRDFKRITIGPGKIYVYPKNRSVSYILEVDQEYSVDLFGWSAAVEQYMSFVDTGGEYPPNEQNAINDTTPQAFSKELLWHFPNVSYIFGISFSEIVVKPGQDKDNLLLDNAAGYPNHNAPGAYRIHFKVNGFHYIPVYTGSLSPYVFGKTDGTGTSPSDGKYVGGFFQSLQSFPFDTTTYPNPNVLYTLDGYDDPLYDYTSFGCFGEDEEWEPTWQEAYDCLLGFIQHDADVNPSDINTMKEEIVRFLETLGYNSYNTSPDLDIDQVQIDLYEYPSVKEYFNIFNKYGFRDSFSDSVTQLDDREKNRLSLNSNSVVWDYRFYDKDYFKGHMTGFIGNGLIEQYYYDDRFDFAMGVNSAFRKVPSSGSGMGDLYRFFHPQSPMYIPYVSTSIDEMIDSEYPDNLDVGDFGSGNITETVDKIKTLTMDSISLTNQSVFVPIIDIEYKLTDTLSEQVVDPRELRFIHPPAPLRDYYHDILDGYIGPPLVQYSYSKNTMVDISDSDDCTEEDIGFCWDATFTS